VRSIRARPGRSRGQPSDRRRRSPKTCMSARAEFQARHVLQAHRRPPGRIRPHDDLAELLGVGKGRPTALTLATQTPCRQGQETGRSCPRRPGRSAPPRPAECRRAVSPEIGELVRIEPDTHRIAPLAKELNVADAGDAFSGGRRSADRRSSTALPDRRSDSGDVRLTIRTKFRILLLDRERQP